MQSFLHGVAEYLTPVKTSSSFREKGVLTPEEFVAAGDLLVLRCPSWSWEKGDKSKLRSYLPEDKQYLITRNVPCRQRVRGLEYNDEDEMEADGDSDWLKTHKNHESEAISDLPEISDRIGNLNVDDEAPKVEGSPCDAPAGSDAPPAGANSSTTDTADVCDSMGVVEEGDTMTLWQGKGYMSVQAPDDNILKTRTYDVCITYDKYYQTPRVWLFGYDEDRNPLTPDQIFEDISQDHAHKTVTIESHPHLDGVAYASIHPCRHAGTMKKIVDHLAESGKEGRSDQYMFLFLKFISSVIPTIEYDFTFQMDA
eukprot:Rmarinus@m.6963